MIQNNNKSFQLLHRRRESGSSTKESSYCQLKKTLKICKDLKEDPTCNLSLNIEQRKISMLIYKLFEKIHKISMQNMEEAFSKITMKEISDIQNIKQKSRLEEILFQVYSQSSPQIAQPLLRSISNRNNYVYFTHRNQQQQVTDISTEKSEIHFDQRSCSRTDFSGSIIETSQQIPLFCKVLNGVIKSIQLKQKVQAFQIIKRIGEPKISDFSQFLLKLNLLQAKAQIFNDQLLSLQIKSTRLAYKQILDFAQEQKRLSTLKIQGAEKLFFQIERMLNKSKKQVIIVIALLKLQKPKKKQIKPGADKIFEKITNLQNKTLRQTISIIALLKFKNKKIVSLVVPIETLQQQTISQQNIQLDPKPSLIQPVPNRVTKNPDLAIKMNNIYLDKLKDIFQILKQYNKKQYVVTLQIPIPKVIKSNKQMESNMEIFVQTLNQFKNKIIKSYCYDFMSNLKKTLFRKSFTNLPSRNSFRKSLQNENDQTKCQRLDLSIGLEESKQVFNINELKNGQEVIFSRKIEMKFEVKLVIRKSNRQEDGIRGHRRARSICKPQEPQPESPKPYSSILEVPDQQQRKLSKMGRAATMKQITQKKDITSRKLRVPTEPQKIVYVVDDNLKKGYLLKAIEKSQDILIPNDSSLLLNLRLSQNSQIDFRHASKQYAFEMTPIKKVDKKRISLSGNLLVSQFSSFSSDISVDLPTLQQKSLHYVRIAIMFLINVILSLLYFMELLSGRKLIGSAFLIPISHLIISPTQLNYVEEFYKSSKVKIQVFITFLMTVIINILQQVEWKYNKNCLIYEFQAEFFAYVINLVGLFYIGFEIFKIVRRNQ